MSAPTEKKQEADLSPEVDSLLPQAHSLAKVSGNRGGRHEKHPL